MPPKQIIALRTDLNMRKGKMCAQAAHASMKVFLDLGPDRVFARYNRLSIPIPSDPAIWEWLNDRFTKIVVGVGSEAELLDLHERAKAAGLLTALVQDAGATEFHGVPTFTAVAVGPAAESALDRLTRHLPLL